MFRVDVCVFKEYISLTEFATVTKNTYYKCQGSFLKMKWEFIEFVR